MFEKRSQEKELLDLGPEYYTQDEYSQCLKKLFRANKLLGFFQSTVKLLKRLPTQSTLLDVGCGGGLFLLHLSRFFPQMHLRGIDISSAAIDDAQQSLKAWQNVHPTIRVSFHKQDQPQLLFSESQFDVILATLVCHHLTDDELVVFLRQAYASANKIVIINDLHRHNIAHLAYRLLSPLFFHNRLMSHDGLISIRRGFIRGEWELLLQKAGIKQYRLKWCFPFRWQLILWK